MILVPFVNEEKEEVFNRLEIMMRNMDSGMTKKRYLDMCEQLKKEPSPLECPPDIEEDFPEIVTNAFIVFNRLGDRYSDGCFIGKEYYKLKFYVDLYDIEKENLEFFLDVLNYLEDRAIKKSSDILKKQYDKAKRGTSGK